MPDLLNVANPVPGRETAASSRAIPLTAVDPKIPNVANPTRVNQADSNAGQQKNVGPDNRPLRPNYESNVQAFFNRLRDTEGAVEQISRFFIGLRTVASSGLRTGSTGELAQILEMLQMSESEFLQFLTDQFDSGNRFGGPLFALLRSAYQAGESQSMREDILRFLKQYNDWLSSPHIERNLLGTLKRMTGDLPGSWQGKAAELAQLLEKGIAAGDKAGTLKLLQGRIMPYLAGYVEQSRNMGNVRSGLTRMMLDIARYENGMEEGMLKSFHQLLGYAPLQEKLGGLSDQGLLELFRSSAYSRAAGENVFADRLAQSADQALRGMAGNDAQNAFRALVSALLVNESVYMPVNHYLIPLNWNGRMMFSELWVDPDEEQNERKGQEEEEPVQRFLFKADIQSLGMFDIVMVRRGASVDLDVRCPGSVSPFSALIQEDLRNILKEDGLEIGSIQVGKLEEPLKLSEVFPNILRGGDSVNVKI